VGGVNEKVEGFYYVCKRRGLTGSEGVVVPAANVQHLMLREEVVEAVREGSFNVWAAGEIDQVIEILTGIAAGERGADGAYPEGTINRRIEDRLAELAETARRFKHPSEGEGGRDGRGAPDRGAP
jgi:predicted ATP-dependent protease